MLPVCNAKGQIWVSFGADYKKKTLSLQTKIGAFVMMGHNMFQIKIEKIFKNYPQNIHLTKASTC